MSGARRRTWRCAAALASLAWLLPPPAVAALSCSLSSVNPVDFGSVSPLDAAATDVSSTFTVTCQAVKGDLPGPAGSTRVVNLCASYDDGTGGASAGGNRQLLNGANAAIFDLYANSAYGPTHWGNRNGVPAGTVVQASVTLTKTGGPGTTPTPPRSTALTAYARLFGGQNMLPPATYTSTLTLRVDAFWNDLKSDCAAGGAVESAPSAAQLVTAAYQNECRVGTINSLDFGASGFLTSNVDAATSVAVTCTSSTPFRVGLDAGTGAGATTGSRKMTRTSPPFRTVDYGLYRDFGRSLNWGNDTVGGTDTQNGTGTGAAASYPIYGRVPPQTTPEPGDYLDTIVLGVVF